MRRVVRAHRPFGTSRCSIDSGRHGSGVPTRRARPGMGTRLRRSSVTVRRADWRRSCGHSRPRRTPDGVTTTSGASRVSPAGRVRRVVARVCCAMTGGDGRRRVTRARRPLSFRAEGPPVACRSRAPSTVRPRRGPASGGAPRACAPQARGGSRPRRSAVRLPSAGRAAERPRGSRASPPPGCSPPRRATPPARRTTVDRQVASRRLSCSRAATVAAAPPSATANVKTSETTARVLALHPCSESRRPSGLAPSTPSSGTSVASAAAALTKVTNAGTAWSAAGTNGASSGSAPGAQPATRASRTVSAGRTRVASAPPALNDRSSAGARARACARVVAAAGEEADLRRAQAAVAQAGDVPQLVQRRGADADDRQHREGDERGREPCRMVDERDQQRQREPGGQRRPAALHQTGVSSSLKRHAIGDVASGRSIFPFDRPRKGRSSCSAE
jgi:hypothetical protein